MRIHIDGAARGNPGPAGAGVVVADAHDHVVKELQVYLGETTNNVAEYAALLLALHEAARWPAAEILVRTDSELLVRQMSGQYRVKDPTLRMMHALAKQWMAELAACRLMHVPREHNRAADRAANRAVESGLRAATAKPRSATSPADPSQQTFSFGAS